MAYHLGTIKTNWEILPASNMVNIFVWLISVFLEDDLLAICFMSTAAEWEISCNQDI